MATNIKLIYEDASARAREVEAAADEINKILQTLVSEVDSNINNASVWTGVSADKFKATWDGCAENFNDFVNHIKNIQQKIDYTANEISAFDQK